MALKPHDIFMQSMHAKHKHDGPPGPECPECMSEVIQSIVLRLNYGDEKFDQLTGMIETNTKITKENAEALHDVREIVVMGRSLFKMAGWLGNAIKWIAGLIVAVGAVLATMDKWFK